MVPIKVWIMLVLQAQLAIEWQILDALDHFDEGIRFVYGLNATAGIFATYPADFASTGTCLYDQVRRDNAAPTQGYGSLMYSSDIRHSNTGPMRPGID